MEALKVILGYAVPALALTLPRSQPQNCAKASGPRRKSGEVKEECLVL